MNRLPRLHGLRLAGLTLPLALLLALAPDAHAEPPAVSTGLWEVDLMTTISPGRAPGTRMPGTAAPVRRKYRLCLDAVRARAPVRPGPAGLRGGEVLTGRRTVSGNGVLRGPDGPRQADFVYRRLSSVSFEGSLDVESPSLTERTQYLASHLAADCGDIKPQPAPDTGLP
jgi:hypothetical protein